jgi:hypothetical protein
MSRCGRLGWMSWMSGQGIAWLTEYGIKLQQTE